MDIPQVIAGRFRIECEIGKGGMGTVYRALHLGLERPVAIKVLKQEFAADPEVAERFMREARTMARLRHPRAAMIFDAGRLTDGRPFIVMEYVEGRTLADTLAREGKFTPERAVSVASDICDVLAEAHQLGVVHRDLKPSNIMLNERGVCVLDFGIAKVLASADATKTHATTQSGLVIGTPRYMSPEQCMGQRVGPASDLYSVGVMVYEMLAGHPPFVDLLSSAVLVKQATVVPPPLLASRPEAPRQLAVIVHTLLAKNPAHRPKSADEARSLLIRSITPPRDPSTQTPPFASTIAALNTGTSAFFRAASVFAVVLMLGAALFAWSHQTVPTRTPARTEAATPSVPATKRAPRSTRRAAATAAPAPVLASAPAAPVAGEQMTVAASEAAPVPAAASEAATLRTATEKRAQAELSPDAIQRIAQSVSRGTVNDVRLVRTKGGQLIAALHDQRQKGASHLYFMERRGERYHVGAHVALDTEGFRGANWTTEVLDIDGDGYDEVLCTGTRPRGNTGERRVVLYVPRLRQTYSLHLAPHRSAPNTIRAIWSANSSTAAAKQYRTLLRQRAFADTRSF
ncbi:MAG TPA: protein kinase [Pyrinomonadaceae bacterium]|jgi:serine/threonine protein kinase|nr:protein kinase [Pyrinomonadaceae bacterium]